VINTLTGHNDVVSSVTFGSDGSPLASAGRDRTVRPWAVATGEQARELQDQAQLDGRLAFSLDGRLLASATLASITRLLAFESAGGRNVSLGRLTMSAGNWAGAQIIPICMP
jgi:WD40 repeat protein